MENLQIVRCDQCDPIRYSLRLEDIEVGYGYVFDRKNNPIEIYIHEQYRSNGYGKYLFAQLLQILKERGVVGVTFEAAEENYRFITIIGQAGAQQIGKVDKIIKFVLKIS